MKNIDITINVQHVADMLKHIVNNRCADGFKWFPNTKRAEASLFDILAAIKVLEEQAERTIHVVEDEDE